MAASSATKPDASGPGASAADAGSLGDLGEAPFDGGSEAGADARPRGRAPFDWPIVTASSSVRVTDVAPIVVTCDSAALPASLPSGGRVARNRTTPNTSAAAGAMSNR